MKKMTKWFIALAALAMLLLLPTMAMADLRLCSQCGKFTEGTTVSITDPSEIEISFATHTDRIFTCSVCSTKTKLWSSHTGGGANCTTEGECKFCHALYKDSHVHSGPFSTTYKKSNENEHEVTVTCTGCRRISRTYTERHKASVAATCIIKATCDKCQETFGSTDPNNHEWPAYIISATKISETQHMPKYRYSCCMYTFNGEPTNHTISKAATCQRGTYCSDCRAFFGSTDSNNHMGATTTTYVKTSESQHTAKITYAECKHKVDGESTEHTETTAATCSKPAYCADCDSNYGDPDPTNHVGETFTTYAKISETQHMAEILCFDCRHKVTEESTEHTETTAATCSKPAYCADCESNYGAPDPNAHDLESHAAQAPTCAEIGWTAYETCSRCDYSTYEEKPARSHWYGEWAPNADGTHSATCRRGCGYRKTVPCTLLTCQLQSDAPDTAFTLCPVCGEVSDGARLILAEAAAKAVTGKLPAGEVVVRIGALAGGEQLMSVAFERGGELTRPTGRVKITLPAELLAGYTLSLLSEDGTETLLTDVQDGSFVLDFSGASSPVRVIRLVPAA